MKNPPISTPSITKNLMRKAFSVIAVMVLIVAAAVPANAKTVSVRGHITKNGKYIAPSHRTSPGHNKFKNWSSKGNVNPYTGKAGTKNPSVK